MTDDRRPNPDPMEVEREREASIPDPARALVPDRSVVSSLEDPDVVEIEDELAGDAGAEPEGAR